MSEIQTPKKQYDIYKHDIIAELKRTVENDKKSDIERKRAAKKILMIQGIKVTPELVAHLREFNIFQRNQGYAETGMDEYVFIRKCLVLMLPDEQLGL